MLYRNKPKKVSALPATREAEIQKVLDALKLERSILASNEEITQAWISLPRHISQIPSNYRNAVLARMCVAIQTGLFDAAINYIWNLSILGLRDKVKQFGFQAIRQILEKDLDDRKLQEMQDADLLDLCLKLNLISEEGFYFIDQCRDIRNNFSAAHPPMGVIDDSELINFISRCCKHVFSPQTLVGVDVKKLIDSLKASRFNTEQTNEWVRRIGETHSAQRDSIVATLHGIYCDPSLGEESRRNSIDICKSLKEITTNAGRELNDRHADYIAKGDEKRAQVSRQFFQELGVLGMLANSESYQVISSAIINLSNAHLGFNNFYNEPAFAERLTEVSAQVTIPDVLKWNFVEVVVSARIGNRYGISRQALPFYERLIKNFSPKEIAILIDLANRKESRLFQRTASPGSCRENLLLALKELDQESIPTSHISTYNKLLERLRAR